MTYRFEIPGRLPNLNDFIEANRRNKYMGAKMKRDAQTTCETYIMLALRDVRIGRRVQITYRWYETDGRRDIDNISGFGHKVIQDALVSCKVLKDDGQKYISGYTDEFYIDKAHPRIEVEIAEV